MAEPDGNPPPPSPLPSPEPPAPAPPERPEALMPAPRVNPPSVFNQKDATGPAPVSPAGFNDFLAWVQTLGGAPAPPAAEASRGILSKKEKKFHRGDSEASRKSTAAEAVEPGLPKSSDIGRTLPVRGELRDSGQPPPLRKRRQKSSTASFRSYRGLTKRLLQAAVLVGIFLLGRATVTKNNPVPISVIPRASLDRPDLDGPTSDLINQAMAAEAQGDFAKATGLLEQVQRERTRVPGLDYHLALLAYEANNQAHALVLLNQSIEKGENIAACYNLRGTLNNRSKGVIRGLDELATATQSDPFEAKYFYFLGEALRRSGKPQAALQQLQLALDRLREPTLEGIYQLKIRLAQIELGREDDFKSQLAEELQRQPLALDWVLTAAAVEMHAGHFEAAAGYLDKALSLVDQETLNIRLRDYFFYGFAREKPLVRFYTSIEHPNAPAAKAAPPAAADTPVPAAPSLAPTLAPAPTQ